MIGRHTGGNLPVSIDETGVDVIGALYSSDWLQADPRGFVRHDVHKAILEFVAWKVGTDESGSVSFRVGKTLSMEKKETGHDWMKKSDNAGMKQN